MIPAGEMDRNLPDPFMVDLAHIEIREPGKFKLNGQRLKELIFGDRPESDQDFTDTPSLGPLKINRFKQLGFGQTEFVFEDRSYERSTGSSSFIREHPIMDGSSQEEPKAPGQA